MKIFDKPRAQPQGRNQGPNQYQELNQEPNKGLNTKYKDLSSAAWAA